MAHRETRQRVVVVTGASAGLGRAVAHAFAEKGDRVALLARGAVGLESATRELSPLTDRVLALAVDTADFAALGHAAQQVEEQLGPIDVWVNNAMVSVFAPFMEIEMDEFRRVTEVDYLGYVHGTRIALERMMPRDSGVVVQVGSALAFRSIPLQSAYCGAKHAIAGFTESLRTELMAAHSNVGLTAVNMPALNTPQFDWVRSKLSHRPRPVAPIYQPEVGARAVVFAADHPRRPNYYVGASTSLTVAAEKFAPVLLDHYLARTGFAAQQDKEPDPGSGPGNLDDPVADDCGAHGRFDAQAHRHASLTWLSQRRAVAGAAAASALAGAFWLAPIGRRVGLPRR